ncbi:MAG: phosphoesterase [Deltaproteobacteria bacterium]|nr:phosphoesterase [Deltaproteobacteria bacterium]
MALDLERSKRISSQLVEGLRGKGRVLILSHDNPDPDSLAAAMALKHFIVIKTGQQCVVAYGGIIGRGENLVMVKELEIDAVPLEKLDPEDFQVICLVDTQPGVGNNSLPANLPVDLVIDHHPLRPQTQQCRWFDIREDYGCTATILFEYLKAQEVSFGTKLATIIYYAIKSETQELGREWCPADREAYLALFPLVNNRILFNITHPKVPRCYFFSFNKALKNARIYEDLLIFNLFSVNNPDMVSEMADFLLRMEGVALVLGMGLFNGKEIISLRTATINLLAGDLIGRIIGDLGTSGGHGLMAGGQIPDVDSEPAAQRRLQAVLTDRLLNCLDRQERKGKKLIPS